jgi:hypothetical protein
VDSVSFGRPRSRGVDDRFYDGLLDQVADLAEPPGWHRDAACRGMGPAAFFPESRSVEAGLPAMQICITCRVVEQCAEAGASERHGIWGGQRPASRSGRRVGGAARLGGRRAATLG